MQDKRARNGTPRPFLKWVGGKGQLLAPLAACVEAAGPFRAYHEPFIGGGALFFELFRTGRLREKDAFLSDTNIRLIEAYLGVRNEAGRVIALLHEHKQRHCKEYYYAMRSRTPDELVERAARIIYLNKTCFNGLFRENSKGLFNVPMGRYANPVICDEANLRAVSSALQHARIEARPFDTVLDTAQAGDLAYFDPPYDPVSSTASFTSYASTGFGGKEQERLAGVFRELSEGGVMAILSNSKTRFIEALYEGFHQQTVYATRNVNSRADRRGAIEELLVTNFAWQAPAEPGASGGQFTLL